MLGYTPELPWTAIRASSRKSKFLALWKVLWRPVSHVVIKSHDAGKGVGGKNRPGFASFVAFMLALEGIVNLSLKDLMWSFASRDSAYSLVFASLGKTGLVSFARNGRGCPRDPILSSVRSCSDLM